jgi:hypothetical protein
VHRSSLSAVIPGLRIESGDHPGFAFQGLPSADFFANAP